MRQTGDQHFYDYDHDDFDDYDHDNFSDYDHDDVGDFYDDHGDFDDFDCLKMRVIIVLLMQQTGGQWSLFSCSLIEV